MAFKQRKPAPIDPVDIEAFAAGAENPAAVENAQSTATSSAVKDRRVGEWPAEVARTMLIRWPDPTLAVELATVAKMDDRSQHATALRALQRGLEILKSELKA
ncbi:hypothetical protein [uncultured Citricoccus sp.]|uniref:hypothetical protein n=1 Tax=uncultured Citricoccus sp. TaxID=614031 RepID=UPI002608670F|nr:hypothetical protein [uncultured Citricoccus sp.]